MSCGVRFVSELSGAELETTEELDKKGASGAPLPKVLFGKLGSALASGNTQIFRNDKRACVTVFTSASESDYFGKP